MDALALVASGGPRPVLWDPFGTLPLQPMGWLAIVARLQGVMAARGIVVDESEAHLLGAFPDSMNSLLISCRVFSDEPDARSWLQQLVDPDLPVA